MILLVCKIIHTSVIEMSRSLVIIKTANFFSLLWIGSLKSGKWVLLPQQFQFLISYLFNHSFVLFCISIKKQVWNMRRRAGNYYWMFMIVKYWHFWNCQVLKMDSSSFVTFVDSSAIPTYPIRVEGLRLAEGFPWYE